MVVLALGVTLTLFLFLWRPSNYDEHGSREMYNRKDVNHSDSDSENNTVHFKEKTVTFKSRLFLFYWIFAIHGIVYFE